MPKVVIVDANGIRHTFPEGFDPVEAARIVRTNAQPENRGALSKFIDWATSPTAIGTSIKHGAEETANAIDTTARTPVHSTLTDFVKNSPDILKDVASGLIHNPVATLRGGAAGVEQGIGEQAEAMSSPLVLAAMGAGPVAKQVAKVAPSVANIIRTGGSLANGGLTAQGAGQALTAPTIEGKLMGASQALLGAHGVGSDPAVVEASRKVSAPVGRALVEASKKPGFIHGTAAGLLGGAMSGSIGEGAALGAAGYTMIPPVMRAAGEGLIRFGEGTTGVQPTAAATGAEPVARPAGKIRATDQTIGETAGEAAKRLADEAKAARKAASGSVTGIPTDAPVGAASFFKGLEGLSPAERRAEMTARTGAKPARDAAATPVDTTPDWVKEAAQNGSLDTAAQDLPTTGKMEEMLRQQPVGLLPGGTGPTGLDLLKDQTRLIDQLPADGPNSGPAPAGFEGEKFTSNRAAARNLFGGNIPEDSLSLEARLPRATDANPMIKSIGPDRAAPDAAAQAARVEGVSGPHGMQAQMLEALQGRGNAGILPEGATIEGQAVDHIGQPLPGPAIGDLPAGTPPPAELPADAEISGEANPIGQQASGPNAGGSTGIEPQSFEDALASAMREGTGKPASDLALTEPTVVPDNDPRVAGPVPASAMQAPLAAEPVEAPPATTPKPRVRVTSEGTPAGAYPHPDTGEMMHPINTVFEPSKSRRSKSQMSATKGYTKADMAAMGLDASAPVTHITKVQAEAGKAARAARTQKYYQAALEEKAQAEAEAGDGM
jgi:hypothetical protein